MGPRQTGKTKGGYLEGNIEQPRHFVDPMRLVMSTHPDQCVTEEVSKELLDRFPHISKIYPTMIHVVRKGTGNRRLLHKEPVPSVQHCTQEFIIIGNNLKIKNKVRSDDENHSAEI